MRRAIVGLGVGAGLVLSGHAQATTGPMLSGHWTMDKTVLRKSPTLQDADAQGVRFIFVRTCRAGRCVVDLKTPLVKGGFDTDRMFRMSARRWRSRRSADRALCFQPDGSTAYTGRTVEQYSVRISGVTVRDGRTFASAIDVYRRYTTMCGSIHGSAVTLYRGTRSDLP